MRSIGAVLAGLAVAVAGEAQVVVGTIGDSITDEYQAPQSNFRRGLEGFSWVEILSRTRSSQISFGAYDASLDASNVPGGYAHNEAIGGAMVLNSNLPQQLAQLDSDVAAGDVHVAVVWIGANDFLVRKLTNASFDSNDPSFQAFQSSLVGALANVLDTLIADGATDILLGQLGVVDPTRSDIVSATQDTNDKLKALATARPRVTFFNPTAKISALVDPATRTLQIGGFPIVMTPAPSSALVPPPGGVMPAQCGFDNATGLPGCPSETYQGFGLNDDGAHLTTGPQGLIANQVLETLNTRGFSFTPLTDAEIVAIAGVTPPSQLSLVWSKLATKCKASGCRLKGKLSVRNVDSQSTGAATVHFVLSDDPIHDASDRLVGEASLPPLAPGKFRKIKLKATLPPGVTISGEYLITATTGGANAPDMVQGPLN